MCSMKWLAMTASNEPCDVNGSASSSAPWSHTTSTASIRETSTASTERYLSMSSSRAAWSTTQVSHPSDFGANGE